MNITFLIGNGFDIGMGLKSKFSDYFPIYQAETVHKNADLRGMSESIQANQAEWSYFEKQLGQYAKSFTPATKQTFIAQLRDFESGFIEYLVQQEAQLSFADSQAISATMKQALTRYWTADNLPKKSVDAIYSLYKSHISEEHRYHFVSFNYTSILEKCLEAIKDGIVEKRKVPNVSERLDRIGKVIHVHGTNTGYPIIGVNDASQIANQELAADQNFLRYVVKPSINDAIRMDYDKDTTTLITESAIICVYGMSLGETDRKWWGLISKWLAGNDNRQLIIFDYDRDFSKSTPFAWLEKEDQIINRLSEYASGKITADSLRSRIHIAVHKNIFEMDLAKRHNDIMDMALEKLVSAL